VTGRGGAARRGGLDVGSATKPMSFLRRCRPAIRAGRRAEVGDRVACQTPAQLELGMGSGRHGMVDARQETAAVIGGWVDAARGHLSRRVHALQAIVLGADEPASP